MWCASYDMPFFLSLSLPLSPLFPLSFSFSLSLRQTLHRSNSNVQHFGA